MKRFLLHILLVLIIPITILLAVYLITDPYKTLRPFSLDYFDETNRDYLSSELFLHNIDDQHYDSYIFGSSRGCGINTYHWLKYLPEGSKQFLFQGWGETLTGIEQKITYIDEHGYDLKNAIILIDIPGTFNEQQLPNAALSIKHPDFSHQSYFHFQSILFYDYLQKPSQWVRSVSRCFKHNTPIIGFDPISNDWDGQNKESDLNIPPQKDSLNQCSAISKSVFLKEIADIDKSCNYTEKPIIDDSFKSQLQHIKEIFLRHNTDYRIVITPAYCYLNPSCNPQDMDVLVQIFGTERVYDYSGKNELTTDYNNFTDPNHFGLFVGWQMVEDIYGSRYD